MIDMSASWCVLGPISLTRHLIAKVETAQAPIHPGQGPNPALAL